MLGTKLLHLINKGMPDQAEEGDTGKVAPTLLVMDGFWLALLLPKFSITPSKSNDKSHQYAITYIPCIAASRCGSLQTSQNIFPRRS